MFDCQIRERLRFMLGFCFIHLKACSKRSGSRAAPALNPLGSITFLCTFASAATWIVARDYQGAGSYTTTLYAH